MIANGLIGLGCAPIYMGALFVFARTFPLHRFGLLASWMLALGSSGNLLAATPLAYAARELGWRNAFLLIAGLTLICAVLVAAFTRDPPHVSRPQAKGSAVAELLRILSLRALWPLVPLTLVSYAIVAVERGLWVGPFFSQVYDLDSLARGNAVLAMAVAMSAGALAYGPLDQAFGTRKWVVAFGSLAAAVGFSALWLWPKPPLFTAVVVIAAIGAAGMTYGVLMAHAREFFPEHLLGRGITYVNALFIGGAGIVQWLSGIYVARLAAEAIPAPALYAQLHLAFAVTLAVATAIYLFSREKPLRTESDHGEGV